MLTETNTEQELIQGIIKHGIDILEHCKCSNYPEMYVDCINENRLNYPIPPRTIDISDWMIPEEYKNMDIEEFLVNQCPEENYQRLVEELTLYRQKNLIPVLKAIKYVVDTLRKNEVIWGVGRGSSVASYVLFLLGVHKIDSIKYKLPIEEFFKGEQNG
jgi:DNA polymerase III alpha subunit